MDDKKLVCKADYEAAKARGKAESSPLGGGGVEGGTQFVR